MLNKNKIFIVGGFVRDTLLGREPNDIDYVVVGSSPEEMIELGYSQVGADFPVFLHPETKDEYALARTERKSGKGYNGFVTDFSKDVTLEMDLARRDIRVNAIAMDCDGTIIDPFNGQQDLKDGILRHVSEAFAEDPVRVLRIARFAARYDFEIAPETFFLIEQMVRTGELDHLTPERVWSEFEKGVKEDRFDIMIKVLRNVGALEVIIPEFLCSDDILDYVKHAKQNEVNNHLILATCLSKIHNGSYESYTLPHKVTKTLNQVNRIRPYFLSTNPLTPDRLVELFHIGNLRRDVAKFLDSVYVTAVLFNLYDLISKDIHFTEDFYNSIDDFLSVNTGAIALATENKKDIPMNIKRAEIQALTK